MAQTHDESFDLGCYADLFDILEERERLAGGEFRALSLDNPTPSDKVARQDAHHALNVGTRKLPKLPDPAFRTIKHWVEWWKVHRQRRSNSRESFVWLDEMLRQLDLDMRVRELEWYSLPSTMSGGRFLAIGSCWWQPKGNDPRHLARPFPSLRAMHVGRDEVAVTSVERVVFQPALDAGILRFGLCSLSRVAETKFIGTHPSGNNNSYFGFKAVSVGPSSGSGTAHLEELRACVDWAVKERIHVLCLPELCVDGRGRAELQQAISDLVDPDSRSICMVIFGSFHTEEIPVGTFRNIAPVWIVKGPPDVSEVEVIKLTQFSLPRQDAAHSPQLHSIVANAPAQCTHLREDLEIGTRMTLLSTPVGVFGLGICKDFLDRHFAQTVGRIADHIIIPAMNAGHPVEFLSTSSDLAIHDLTATFYVGCRRVVPEKHSSREYTGLAFAYLPRPMQSKKGKVGNIMYVEKHSASTRPLPERGENHMTIAAASAEGFDLVELPLPQAIDNRSHGQPISRY